MRIPKLPILPAGAAAGILLALAAGILSPSHGERAGVDARAAEPAGSDAGKAGIAGAAKASDSVELSEAQVKSIGVGPAATRSFNVQHSAVGSIDFNENRSVQVFAPYQGRILQAFADVGDDVPRGRTLFTIDSPDLVQAESTLIGAAGVLELTSAVLARAKGLYETQGIAQKDLEQAVSDQQAAEGALKAARDAVRIFGKTDAEIDTIVATRRIDPALVVASPIGGRVTARAAQPGLLVQPGSAPPPFVISDLATVWMLADVPESEAPSFRLGQAVRVKVTAWPQRDFGGRITTIGTTVDPNTHTVVLRSEVGDPAHQLRPGMLANFIIRTGDPVASIAVPQNGVVREGDGTMSVWVTADQRHFVRRVVRVGLRQDGYDQITDGLKAGELVVTDGALFLSNMLVSPPDS